MLVLVVFSALVFFLLEIQAASGSIAVSIGLADAAMSAQSNLRLAKAER